MFDAHASSRAVGSLYRHAGLRRPQVHALSDIGKVSVRTTSGTLASSRSSWLLWPFRPTLSGAELHAWEGGHVAAAAATQRYKALFQDAVAKAGGLLRGHPPLDIIALAVISVGYAAAAHAAEDRLVRWQCLRLAERGAAYLQLAEAGAWLLWAFEQHALIVPRPLISERARADCAGTTPTLVWPNRTVCWYQRGWQSAQLPVQHDEPLDPYADILWEPDAQRRRELIDLHGMERFIGAVGREPSAIDDRGRLWRIPLTNDEPLCVVEVVNSTAAPDGTFEHHFLRVPPGIRTAAGAVAWTFGLAAADYDPQTQS